jgi:hypothetical protein
MINIHDRTERHQADEVLAKLKAMIREEGKRFFCSVDVEAYENGREHGYYLEMWRTARTKQAWAVSFSEYRTSDDIVVYFGKSEDFDNEGHVPTQLVWENMKTFKYQDFDGAAAFIFDYLFNHEEFRTK